MCLVIDKDNKLFNDHSKNPAEYPYLNKIFDSNYFENHFFHWESQTTQKQDDLQILDIVNKNYDKNIDLSKYPTIKNIKIQTCITNINKLNNKIEGYAISNTKIKNVEISVDYGKRWMKTNIISPKNWLFVLWNINYDIKNIKEIWCRAESYDGIINTDSLDEGWNIRGICNDSIYKKYI